MISGRFAHAVKIKILRSNPQALLEAFDDTPEDQPDSIASSIGKWRLLENVPFNYLVPDASMAPPESIRFFQVDDLWINSLIDGALSLGGATRDDLALAQALTPRLHANGRAAAASRRAERLGIAAPPPVEVPTSPGIASGFLLRSNAVSGWPGMEAEGQDSNGTKLNILRLAHLADDVLFGLFDGLLETLILHPPSEGLHFGFGDDGKKQLRFTANESGSQMAGDPIPGQTVSLTLRDGATAGRVLNIAQLKQDILAGLQQSQGNNTVFTAAEFALEMTTGIDEVVFSFPKRNVSAGNPSESGGHSEPD